MDEILGYDCDGNEIFEYRILRAIWSNDVAIEESEDADPRQYCAIMGDDGNAYAISVYDWWNKDLIRERENIKEDEEIPVIVKPISEMEHYEVAQSYDGEFYYDLDCEDLKKKLNKFLHENKVKKIVKKDGSN